MPIISMIGFGLFALIAIYNAISVLKSSQEHHISVVPFLGLVFFVLAMLDWSNSPMWLWLLVFLDMGTLMLMISLPALIMDVWRTSRFCRYALFVSDQEKLTLYRHGDYQSFHWQWTGDVLPMYSVVGFSGDWCQIGDEWLFYSDDHEPYFKAVLTDDKLTMVFAHQDFVQFYHKVYQKVL